MAEETTFPAETVVPALPVALEQPSALRWWGWLIPLIAAAALYYPSLQGDLVWDDGIVAKDQMMAFHSLHSVFFPPKGIPQWGTSYYRPMVTLSYLADQALFGHGATRGPHGAVILFHLIATFFVWVLARQVLHGRPWKEWGAVAAGVLFAVHPIHTESVCWITGRSDTVATMFLLPAVVTALYYRGHGAVWALIVSPVLFLCAILSKEVALAGLLVVPLLLLLAPRPTSARRGARLWLPLGGVYLLATAIYALLRAHGASYHTGELKIAWSELVQRAFAAISYYLTKIVVPPPQSAYPTHLPGMTAIVIAAAIAVLVLAAGIWRSLRGAPLILISIGWIFLTLAPSMLIAVRQVSETPVAERYLYLPSVGLCLLASGLVGLAWSRRWLLAPSLIVLVGAIGVYSYWARGRVAIWDDNIALWTDVTAKDPAGLPWHTLGQAYLKRNQDAKALECFDKALETYKSAEGRALAWNSKGAVIMKTNPAEAAFAFQKSIKERPTYATPYFNLGLMGLTRAELDARNNKFNLDLLNYTRGYLAEAIKYNPLYTWAYLSLGKCNGLIAVAHLKANDKDKAREAFLAARQGFQTVCQLDPHGRYGQEAAALIPRVDEQLAKVQP